MKTGFSIEANCTIAFRGKQYPARRLMIGGKDRLIVSDEITNARGGNYNSDDAWKLLYESVFFYAPSEWFKYDDQEMEKRIIEEMRGERER